MSSVPLTQAVTSGDASAVSTVLANGADVNERTGGGQTPLILATIFGHTHLLPLLLDAGADPQLRDNLGLNAIDWAQRRGATEAIEVLTNKPRPRSSIERPVETRQPVKAAAPRERDTDEPRRISAEERSQRWLAGLKQRIAELPQHDVSERPNIFMRQPEPPPEIPEVPKPSPEIPEFPSPQPEIPTPGPDIPELPKPELPDTPPELPTPVSPPPPQPQPEIPSQPPVTEPPTTEPPITEPPVARMTRHAEAKTQRVVTEPPTTEPPITEPPVARMTRHAEAKTQRVVAEPPTTEPPITEPPVARMTRHAEATPPRVISIPLVPDLATIEPRVTEPPSHEPESTTRPRSARKRCPKCGAIYNSELVAYCAHHYVPLVDADEPPIISDPSKTSPVMFWMIIIITLTGSVVIGSIVTAFFYNPARAEPPTASSSPPKPTAVQKGTPVVGAELEGKVASLPIAECPLNGQEAIPGTVVVHVIIDKTGKVTSARATGGDWLLRGAASEAALKSTFAPEKLRSRETEGTITYTFEP